MQIPTFFLRTNARLWIFQALVAWISIRCHYLPINSTISFAITSTLGSYVNDAKDILDSRYGFILPLESAYFLPAALEAYVVGSMPELAILLGTSPCDDRITPKDPVSKICAPEIAFHCQYFADTIAHKSMKASLRVMEACWEMQHTSAETARKHHDRAHKDAPPFLMQVVGCMQAMDYWEKKLEICAETRPVMYCLAEFGGSVIEKQETGQMSAVEGHEEVPAGHVVKAAPRFSDVHKNGRQVAQTDEM